MQQLLIHSTEKKNKQKKQPFIYFGDNTAAKLEAEPAGITRQVVFKASIQHLSN